MKLLASRLFVGTLFVAASALPLASSFAKPAKTSAIPSISHAALMQAIKAKRVTVIDVNGTDSFKAGHIPGALNYDVVEKNLKAKLPKNKNALVVAYCGSPQCGAYKAAAMAAMKMGYTNVKHYSPGISGWKKAGAPLQKA